MSPRAGIKGYNPVYSFRGSGWGTSFIAFLRNAAKAFKDFVLPRLKQHGPDIAKAVASYAMNQGKQFLKSRTSSDVQTVVDRVTEDLPQIVSDVVRRQTDQRGSGPAYDDIVSLQNAVVAARPYIRDVLNTYLLPKMNALVRLSKRNTNVMTNLNRLAVDRDADIKQVMQLQTTMPEDALYILRITESIIVAVVAMLYEEKMLDKTHPLYSLIEGAMTALKATGSNWEMAQPLQQRRQLFSIDNEPVAIQSLLQLMPGIGPLQLTERIQKKRSAPKRRGGIAPLVALAVPALATGIPALVSAVSDIVSHWTRGSGDGVLLNRLDELASEYNSSPIDRQMAMKLLSKSYNSPEDQIVQALVNLIHVAEAMPKAPKKARKR